VKGAGCSASLLSLGSALVTEMLGIHALFGAFAAGVAVSSNAQLRDLLMARVEPFAVTLLLLFFAMTGLRMRADALQASDIVLCVVVIAVATTASCWAPSVPRAVPACPRAKRGGWAR
jgi:Kef-type K+ transport system membrane component KefB